MNNQKGEVVTGVMVVMMVGMMIFGMLFMHGGHAHRNDHMKNEQKQERPEADHHHMHQGDAENAHQPAADEGK